MPTSEARISANHLNSLKSCGPKTVEGKERSRRNGLKHGLTGSGVVMAEDDAAEVERRAGALQAELAPRSEVGEILVRQMATLSVRMERGARQELAAVASRVRHAADDFDEGRIELAGQLLEAIGEDPKGQLRRLRKSPEGVDVLIEAWLELREGLTREPKPVWTAGEMVRAANLVGIRDESARNSTIGVLSRAIWGETANLVVDDDSEGEDIEDDVRKAGARARMVERIDEAVAELAEHRETLDFEAIEQDRAESGHRALFDPSREATLARQYESEASRRFFRALQEFRKAQEEADRAADAEPTPHASRDSYPDPLASSCRRTAPPPRTMPRADHRAARPVDSGSESVGTCLDGPLPTIGRSGVGLG
jgi:hypothetical protein